MTFKNKIQNQTSPNGQEKISEVKNIGIFAHVDAGKTTLTEQLLYASGAIKHLGRVDSGDTHTDTLQLERERGISIMSAPISFNYKGCKVNLIDTPGHVDFVAEVERVMGVLEGAVLVVSAREGVQSHTRLLYSALSRLGVPTLVFVNKIDRMGADIARVVKGIKKQLCPRALPLTVVQDAGSRSASSGTMFSSEALVENIVNTLTSVEIEECSALLEAYLDRGEVSKNQWLPALVAATSQCAVVPILFGSALMGEGISSILEAIHMLLPAYEGDGDGDGDEDESDAPRGVAFKVARSHVKTREVFVKLTGGRIGLREMLGENKVTRIEALIHGNRVDVPALHGGDIGILTGVSALKVGDFFGVQPKTETQSTTQSAAKGKPLQLAKPLLSVQVRPQRSYERTKLLEALVVMADMDPYLCYELSEMDDSITLSLFGFVQMEILSETLRRQYGIGVTFEEPQALYLERPQEIGRALAPMYRRYSFHAGLGFRVEPLPLGSGLEFVSEVSLGLLTTTFQRGAMEGAMEYLDQGLLGWAVTDARIVLEDYDYNSVDSAPSDFRNLAPLVVYQALAAAKTALLWPISSFVLEVPAAFIGDVMGDLVKMRAVFGAPEFVGDQVKIEGRVPVETSMRYGMALAHMTDGQGYVEFVHHGYEPVPESFSGARRPYYRTHPSFESDYLAARGGIAY